MEALHNSYQTVEGKLQQFTAVPENNERVFLLFFFFYMLIASLQTTMFGVAGPLITIVRFLLSVFVLLKIILFDCYTEKELCFAAWLLGDAIAVMIFSGNKEVLFFSVMLLGAKNVSFEKILKVYVLVNVTVLFSAFVASRLDIIEDLVYARELAGERNSFGVIYPTDFAAHVFFLLSAWFYVIRKELRTVHILLGGIVCATVYYYCLTRLDCITMVLLLLGLWVMQHKGGWQNTNGTRQKAPDLLQKITPWSGMAGFFLIYLLSLFYMPNVSIFRFIDELLSGRLRIGNQGLLEYGFSIFGQHIAMNGNGGSVIPPINYFFIDSSYLSVYLCYGIVFLILIFFIHYFCCRKYADDRYYLLIISVIVINCMIAHHMIDLAYNPFYLALLAKKEET